MVKLFKHTVIVLLILFSILMFSSCSGTSPDTSVKGFFDSIKKQDLQAAATFIENGKADFAYDNEQQEKILKSVFNKISYQIVSTNVNGDTAVVKTKVTAPDLVKVTGKMIGDLMGQLFALAFSNDADKEKQSEQLIEQYFSNSINDPNAPLTTTEIDINLVKDKSKNTWVIKSDDNLANAITGNAIEAFSQMNNASSSNESEEDVADSTIYNIGQEAIFGRAAITILNVEKSKGTEFDKPKTGYEYLILSIRERNAGEGEMGYNPNYFKMQNSLGQITDPSFSIIDSDTHFGSGALTTGGKVEGTIVFEVPENDPNLTFLFYPEDKALLTFKLN